MEGPLAGPVFFRENLGRIGPTLSGRVTIALGGQGKARIVIQ